MDHLSGMIFDIQHFAVSDGPGIRTTVFFKGCPLRCEWCHNPESYSTRPQLLQYAQKCAHCGACVQACQQSCHQIVNSRHIFSPGNCTGCGICVKTCPTKALEIAGQRMTVDEILADVLRDTFFYESSGGGLTLSGGEPMFQPAFALTLARQAANHGLHVCLETSGFCRTADLLAMVPWVNLFLYDYKLTGNEAHRQCTGVDQELILHNLFQLDQQGANIILRCPMIPSRNMTEEHISGIIHVAKQLQHLQEIHLEPYHNLGLSKRERLGMQQLHAAILPPERDVLLAMAEEITAQTGIKTIVM